MAGTSFQTYKDLAQPSVHKLGDVEVVHKTYELDQYRDFEINPWQKLTVIPPDVTEYPGARSTMTSKQFEDLNIRKNTEFLLERNSNSLVICVGESWVYGEIVRTTVGYTDLFCHAMHSTLGARIAHLTNSDLHQHAIPGNCTGFIFQAVEKLLDYHRSNSRDTYDKIYVVMHITDLNRDFHQGNFDNFTEHSPSKTYLHDVLGQCLSVQEFYAGWERYYLNYLDQLAHNNRDLGAEFVIYKNLTPWYGPASDRTQKQFLAIDNFWLNWLANQGGKEFPDCYCLNAGQLDNKSDLWNYVDRDPEWINLELDRIDSYLSMTYDSGSEYYSSHPFQPGHKLWAEHICKVAGWNEN